MNENIPIKYDQVSSSLAISVYDKIEFKLKLIRRDKERDFIIIKGAV